MVGIRGGERGPRRFEGTAGLRCAAMAAEMKEVANLRRPYFSEALMMFERPIGLAFVF